MFFVLENENVRPPRIEMREVFAALGMELYFEKYRAEILELEKIYKTIGDGRFIQVFFDRKNFARCSYAAKPFGHFQEIKIASDEKEHATSDMTEIIDVLRKNPEKVKATDDFLCCAVASKDIMLDPCSGIEIYSYHNGDEEAYQRFIKRLNGLLRKIRQEYQLDHGLSWQEMKYDYTEFLVGIA